MSPRSLAIGATLVMAIGIAACGGDGGSDGVVIPEVYDLDHDPAALVADIDPARADLLPAENLRLTLEQLFGWHGITLVEAMQATARGDDGTGAWVDALVGNTDDITAAVGIVYGPVGADAFHQQWAQHTQFLVDYADAVRRGDDGAKTEAVQRLADYAADSGSLLSTALGGALSADDVEALLAEHVAHMMEQLDHYAADRVDEATSTAIDDNAYLLQIAAGLSAGFVGTAADGLHRLP